MDSEYNENAVIKVPMQAEVLEEVSSVSCVSATNQGQTHYLALEGPQYTSSLVSSYYWYPIIRSLHIRQADL